MEWLAEQLNEQKHRTFNIQHSTFNGFRRRRRGLPFLRVVRSGERAECEKDFRLAAEKKIRLTPPPKPVFEEKMLFALLWNRNLQDFWRQELGEGFFGAAEKAGALHVDR